MAKLWVRLADTPYKQAEGLMFVKSMPFDEGMLFSFSRNQVLKFWGENTYIPLDIAFVDEFGKIAKLGRIRPFDKSSVSSVVPCKFAIEANEGFFAKHDIGEGDVVKVELDDDRGYCVSFEKTRNSTFREAQVVQSPIDPEIEEQQPFDATPVGSEADLPIIEQDELNQYLEDAQEEHEPELEPDAQEFEGDAEIIDQPQPMEEGESREEFSNLFDAVKYAEDNSRIMSIVYTTDSGRVIQREVEPHGTYYAQTTNRQILVTFDRTVGGIRAFIMQNIELFDLLPEQFEKKFTVR